MNITCNIRYYLAQGSVQVDCGRWGSNREIFKPQPPSLGSSSHGGRGQRAGGRGQGLETRKQVEVTPDFLFHYQDI